MEIKRFAVSELKAMPSDSGQPGEFEALVSVFGNVDDYGDVMEPGSFTTTIAKALPPIVWSHQWDVPPIGTTISAEETSQGLVLKGRLFVGDGEDSPMARAVYTAMKALDGRGTPTLREFSFGYTVTDAEEKTIDGQTVRSIKAVDLFEAGPCLKGVNPATQLLAVKSALQVEGKAGRVLSKANEESLRQAADLITAVVDQVSADAAADTGKAAEPTSTSASQGAKNADPSDNVAPTDAPGVQGGAAEDRAAVLCAGTHTPDTNRKEQP